jgi:hypothetical protein
MTFDEIIKLAREADPFGEHGRLYQVAELTPETLIRFCHIVRNAALDEAINVIEKYRIPVGNSAAGELACEWTRDALADIRGAIRAMKEQA